MQNIYSNFNIKIIKDGKCRKVTKELGEMSTVND